MIFKLANIPPSFIDLKIVHLLFPLKPNLSLCLGVCFCCVMHVCLYVSMLKLVIFVFLSVSQYLSLSPHSVYADLICWLRCHQNLDQLRFTSKQWSELRGNLTRVFSSHFPSLNPLFLFLVLPSASASLPTATVLLLSTEKMDVFEKQTNKG